MAKDRRRAVMSQIPPKKCKAKSKRRQARCDQWAVVGADVCYMHGGQAPQVQAVVERRVTLAERLASTPEQHPWEVMAATAHASNVVFQDARSRIEAGDFKVEDLEKFISALERAHRLNDINVRTGLAERRQRFAEAQAQQIQAFVLRVLAGLHLTQEQKALVPGLIRREVEGVLVTQGEIAA